MTRFVLAATLLAACGGDDGANEVMDAPRQIDATSNVVLLASCPASTAATMTTGASSFSPMQVTVTAGSVVKITTTVGHTVIPNTLTTTDSALMMGQNQTKCFQFNTAGTYGIACGIHSFPGTITVN